MFCVARPDAGGVAGEHVGGVLIIPHCKKNTKNDVETFQIDAGCVVGKLSS